MVAEEYSNREIDRMFEEIQSSLGRIEAQTVKHNGRLSRLEKWMFACGGAITVLTWLYANGLIQATQVIASQ
jgi:hypothetical protein